MRRDKGGSLSQNHMEDSGSNVSTHPWTKHNLNGKSINRRKQNEDKSTFNKNSGVQHYFPTNCYGSYTIFADKLNKKSN